MFDAHLHLNSDIFYNDLYSVVEKMQAAGITGAVNTGFNLKSTKRALETHFRYPWILPAAGIHPLFIEEEEFPEEFAGLVDANEFAAIGEIGLDFWNGREDEERQRIFLFKQAQLATYLDLPVILHIRKGFYETMGVLAEAGFSGPMIYHSFSGSWEMAKKALDRGCFLSVGGPITYPRKENLREVIRKVPPERILVETDAPDLPPWEQRGETHYPWQLPITIRALAHTMAKSVEETARITEENARRIFNR